MFAFNNELYVVIANRLYTSGDGGETWQPKYEGSGNIGLGAFQYHPMGNLLFASRKDQLYHFDLTDDNLKVKELVNEGIENSQITNAAFFNDTIFVGTTSGTFKRAIVNALEYKNP
jgi:hypothetical protein